MGLQTRECCGDLSSCQPGIANGSVVAFDVGVCCDLPGWMWLMRMPCYAAQASSVPPMYSGPLSQRIATGLPRHSTIWSRAQITQAESNDQSISIPSLSRLESSSTLNSRKLRPSLSWSRMKSIDQGKRPANCQLPPKCCPFPSLNLPAIAGASCQAPRQH